MTYFVASTPSIRQLAAEFSELATAMRSAADYNEEYVRVRTESADAGPSFIDAKERILRVQRSLRTNYVPSGPVTGYYAAAAGALHDIAEDYDLTDAAVAAQYDELLAACAGPDYVREDWVMPVRGETPAINAADLAAGLLPPEDLLAEAVTGWQTFADIVDNVLSLQWVLWTFNGLQPGLTDDLAASLDEIKGAWGDIGCVSEALHKLSEFNFRVSGEIAAAAYNTMSDWQGHAASAAFSSMEAFCEELAQHGEALRNTAQQLSAEAGMAIMWADLAFEAVNAIVDLVNPIDLLNLPSTLTSILKKVMKWVVLGRLAIDMIVGAVHGLSSLLESLADRDVSFPTVAGPPDNIGGPA